MDPNERSSGPARSPNERSGDQRAGNGRSGDDRSHIASGNVSQDQVPPSTGNVGNNEQPPEQESSQPEGISRPGSEENRPQIEPSVASSDFDRSFVDNINNLLRQTAQRFRNPDSNEEMSSNNQGNNETTETTGNENESTTNENGNETTNSEGTGSSSGTVETEGGVGTSNGHIIITVNYIFSDENDPSNPNRTGSLVLTLPNNSVNRDPRTIEELIRLATQMAYSTIINGRQHEKGLSLEKFESFPTKALNEITSNECSICLESFIDINHEETQNNLEEYKANKRRKLNDSSPATQTSREASERHDEERRDRSKDNNRSKLLASAGVEFPHAPVELPCGHIFGQSCLAEWLKSHTTCPLCRTAITDPRSGVETENSNQGTTHNLDFTTGNFNGNDTGNEGSTTNGESAGNNRNENAPFSNFRLIGSNGFDEFLNMLNSRQLRPEDASNRNPRTVYDMLGRASRNSENGGNSNPSTSSMFSNILAYFRRPQPERNPLFPMGVASRRTGNGVVSRDINGSSNENSASRSANELRRPEEDVIDFLNLRGLTDDAESAAVNNGSTENNEDTSESNSDTQSRANAGSTSGANDTTSGANDPNASTNASTNDTTTNDTTAE